MMHIKLTGTVCTTSLWDMHSALRIAELQQHVFAICHRKSLANLARTCKAFHETALDVLWRDDIEIAVLMRVMPPDLWEDNDDTGAIVCIRNAVSCCCDAYS
jgi:hypothetical protein